MYHLYHIIGLCQTISHYNNLKELGPTQIATGISTPTGRISWKPPVDERHKTRQPQVSKKSPVKLGAKSASGGQVSRNGVHKTPYPSQGPTDALSTFAKTTADKQAMEGRQALRYTQGRQDWGLNAINVSGVVGDAEWQNATFCRQLKTCLCAALTVVSA